MSGTLAEHRSYLADSVRFEKFTEAAKQVVETGDMVADLGCGFGVLGFLCLDAGADKVWGIDSTDAAHIAEETALRTGYADRYQCLRQSTFEAKLDTPVDLIICDHVGYFGVDYGIVEMMADARERLLRPGGKMIPQALDLFVAGVSSKACSDLIDTWDNPAIPEKFRWLRSYAVNTKHAIALNAEDIVTDAVNVGHIEFAEDQADTLSYKAVLTAVRDTEMDGLAGWFDCRLGGDVSMTNSPLAADRINRRQIFLGFEQPIAVNSGSSIEIAIKLRHKDGIIAWTVTDPATSQIRRYTTWASTPMGSQAGAMPAGEAPALNARGKATQALLGLYGGDRTAAEIERNMLEEHADIFPTTSEMTRFVRDSLIKFSA